MKPGILVYLREVGLLADVETGGDCSDVNKEVLVVGRGCGGADLALDILGPGGSEKVDWYG